MGIRTKNIGNLFRQGRTRAIIVITGFIVLVAIFVGIWKLQGKPKVTTRVRLGQAPAIESIPGGLNPTEQYAKLQQEQNIQQAAAAKKTGESAIPTIVRTELFSRGAPPVRPTAEEVGKPFSILAREMRLGGITKGLWYDNLKDSKCASHELQLAQQQGATLDVLKEAGCPAKELVDAGYNLPALKQIGYAAKALKEAGFNAMQLRGAGFDAKALRNAGVSACDTKNAGFDAKELKKAGYSDGELLGAGFPSEKIQAVTGLPEGLTTRQVREAGCDVAALKRLREQGVGAAAIRRASGCKAEALKAAGYTAADLKAAGYKAQELKEAGFTAADLLDAGYSPQELKNAGFTAKELKAAGLGAKELRELGYSAKDLLDAGFTPRELKAAGFTARDLRLAGVSAKELQQAGFTAAELKEAGFSDDDIRQAGYTPGELEVAGLRPTIAREAPPTDETDLQRIMRQQAQQSDQQQLRVQTQQRQSVIAQAANQYLAGWRAVPAQQFVAGAAPTQPAAGAQQGVAGVPGGVRGQITGGQQTAVPLREAEIRAGDIMFAVMDTAVNSDEPGPVLATIVQGKLKGARLIGSLNLGSNSDRVSLRFNLMSFKGAPRTISISAVGIDPTTARTALSSSTDHHFLLRYGSMFAAAFLEGYGKAVETKGTKITSNASGETASIETDPKRSTKEFALIGIGRMGQKWAQMAQRNIDRPPTVHIYSGSALGIMFLKDLPTIPGLSKTS